MFLKDARKYAPVWRNWQTHRTQNAAGNHAGSSPATGTTRPFGAFPDGLFLAAKELEIASKVASGLCFCSNSTVFLPN